MLLESQNKKIIVLGSYNSGALSAIYTLSKQGYKPILVAPRINESQMSELLDEFYSMKMTADNLADIVTKTRPDAIIPIFGGQTGINACIKLAKDELLSALNVKILGTDLASLSSMFDREKFSNLLNEERIPTPISKKITNIEEAIDFASEYNYPVIVRASATTNKPGGDLCNNRRELIVNVNRTFEESPISNCLIEASVTGYKELELEVVRDSYDNCILVGAFENIDAVGIHSADSMVVAPIQTLDDQEFQKLRTVSLRLARMFNIVGSCNIRIAFDSLRDTYYILEMNPSFNRSSVLISAITAYPLADIITKISLGIRLDAIRRTGFSNLTAASEPIMDYLAVKVPNWSKGQAKRLGTRRQAKGQIIAFGRSLESALMKAIESMTNERIDSMLTQFLNIDDFQLEENLVHPQANRLFIIAEAFRRGYTIDEISELTKIDAQFLYTIYKLIDFIENIKNAEPSEKSIRQAKELGISDKMLAKLWNIQADKVEQIRNDLAIRPTYKKIDGVAGALDANVSYFYATYEEEDELEESKADILLIDGIESLSNRSFANNQQLLILANSGLDVSLISNSPDTLAFSLSLPITTFFEPLSYEVIAEITRKCNPETLCLKKPEELSEDLKSELNNLNIKITEWNYTGGKL